MITREQLNSLVDQAADIIRTATDYKFILVLLFLKRVSDTWKEEYEEKRQELRKHFNDNAAAKEAENEVYHTFALKRDLLWDEITKNIVDLPQNLSNALIKIADLNKELKGVIDKFSFLGFTTQEHRERLRQLVELFNQYNFSNKYVSSDIVGDAYEHILYRFAPTKAREGEVYTPREVIELLIAILDPRPGQSVYDPAAGSGGMLIGSHKYVREKYGKEEKLLLYGQEYSPDIHGFCRLNLIAHGITDAFVEYGDSLLYPKFTEAGKLKQFEIVIANPPWNQKKVYGEETLKKGDFRERYAFGYPPKKTADWAWIQHMLASSCEKVGIVLDQGALFRGNAEKKTRRQIVEKDWVEAVILLAEKLFYNTGASGILIVFNMNKPPERKNKILFVNASEAHEKHPHVKRLNILSAKNIEKIVHAYTEFQDTEGFARIVGLDEVRGNEFDLKVPLYVTPSIEEETLDLKSLFEELQNARVERDETWKTVEQYIQGALKVWREA